MTREDLDELLTVVLPFAQRMLGTYGEFYPFGAFVTTEGQAHLVSGFAADDHPASTDVLRLLLDRMRQGAAKEGFRATALCTDVRIRHPDTGAESDAIEVSLEDRDGEAMNLYLPYHEEAPETYRFGELLATKAALRIFPAA